MNNVCDKNNCENTNSDIKTYTYDEAMELTGHGRYNYLLLIGCSIISHAVGLDMIGFGIIATAAKCDFQLGITEAGILASAPFTGVIFAYPWGYYADTRGRRKALLWSTIAGFVFASIGSFSPSWTIMMFFKIVACGFSNASFTLTMTLLGECTCAKSRSRFLFIMMSVNLISDSVSFGLAYLILPLTFSLPIPLLGINFNSWRLFSLTLALPLGIGGFIMAYLYESPKFLASRGENVKALEVLKNIYEWNGGKRDEYPVHHIIVNDDVDLKCSFWQSVVNQTVPLFKPPLLWRTIQIFYLMAVCTSTNNAFLMWYSTIVNAFFNTTSEHGFNNGMKFCDRIFNRNETFVYSVTDITTDECDASLSPYTTISGVFYGLFFCIAAIAVVKVAAYKQRVLIFWLIVSVVSGALVNLEQMDASLIFFVLLQTSTIALPSLAGYCVELYPTHLRGLMTSLGMMVARIFSTLGVNIVGAFITNNCDMTFYGWSVYAFSGVIIALFLPSDKTKK